MFSFPEHLVEWPREKICTEVLPALLVISSDPQQASLIIALCEGDAGVIVHRALRDANAEFSVYGASSEMTVELWRDIAAPQLDVREGHAERGQVQ